MEQYSCNMCDKVFYIKSNYDRHLNKKIPCNEEGKTQYQIGKRTCNHCGKIFSSYQSLDNHLDDKCKIKLMNDAEKEDLLTKLIKENEQIKKDIEEMKQKDKTKEDELYKMKEKMSDLETKTSKKVNITNQNAHNIQNINNVKIFAFGKEDLSHIQEADYKFLLNKGFKSVPNFVDIIHFNKNKPENHNIYISNMRDNFVITYDGEKWQLRERDYVLQDMIETKSDILSNKFDELKDKLDEGTTRKFGRFLDEKDEDRVVEQIKKDLKVLLYNNKKVTEKSRELLCCTKNDK